MEVEVIRQRQEGSDTVSEAGHDKGVGHFLGVVGSHWRVLRRAVAPYFKWLHLK